MTADEAIDSILAREGGYVDHPADKGGPTNFGITLATLADWRERPVTADDVQKLTKSEAREIYRENYIRKPGFDAIQDPKLFGLIIDCAVNHGPSRAWMWLNKAGPDPAIAFNRILAERIRFYGQIITKNPSQAVFAAGWLNRAASFLDI